MLLCQCKVRWYSSSGRDSCLSAGPLGCGGTFKDNIHWHFGGLCGVNISSGDRSVALGG